MSDLRSPFPWFGGKRPVADVVWQRLGDVRNYVEPFFGSGAVLLCRPDPRGTETVNDKDGFLSNFWRALQADPDGVARHANRMVNEIDLAAWRDWLYSDMSFQERMWADPRHYDIERAGIWVWGVCSTIGNAWQPKSTHLGGGMGIHRASTHLGDAGRGIHRASTHLGDAGMGIHRASTHLGDAGRGAALREYFQGLALRLERVRVMSGDWSRVTSETVTTKLGLTGMFLDPPYLDKCTATYNHNDDVREAVREYCIANGGNPQFRIALCGYEGEHEMPSDWEVYAWKTSGGYGSQAEDKAGRVNAARERIWFSPHCLSATHVQQELAI